jgi:site-specific recombinase XerD
MANEGGKTTRSSATGVQLDFGFEEPVRPEPVFRTPLDWFESWLNYRMSGTANRLSREAAEPYRYIWSAWCKWLLNQAEGRDWSEMVLAAGPEQASAFLAEQVKPATQRAGSASDISIVTRERYCMVLRDIYAHLERQGLVAHNRMKRLYALAGDERPDAEIVAEPLYRWLRNKWTDAGGTESVLEARDRILMLLMLDLALTPGELAALRMANISEDSQAGAYWLSIDGGRAAQKRQLRVDGVASGALAMWLQHRHRALSSMDNAADVEALVFFTERRRPLSRRVLFHLTSLEIAAACTALNRPLPRHLGPLVLRNTAILHWLRQGMPPEEVCRHAGYQGVVSLEHLRAHLDDGSL